MFLFHLTCIDLSETAIILFVSHVVIHNIKLSLNLSILMLKGVKSRNDTVNKQGNIE
jgi:hypothetical protein